MEKQIIHQWYENERKNYQNGFVEKDSLLVFLINLCYNYKIIQVIVVEVDRLGKPLEAIIISETIK